MWLDFYKYEATGNDFIVIDNRKQLFDITNNYLVQRLCNRKFGIGSDGLLILQSHNLYDFEMIYLNLDGKIGSFCGNGARCMILFAHKLHLFKNKTLFWSIDGLHQGYLKNTKNEVTIKMKDIERINYHNNDFIIDSGSPHYIKFEPDIKSIDIVKEGRKIRNDNAFKGEGINVNFVTIIDNKLHIRTYERGVEDETLSCGTGAVASSVAYSIKNRYYNDNQVKLNTLGGSLEVEFEKIDNRYQNIYLKGNVREVFNGRINIKNL